MSANDGVAGTDLAIIGMSCAFVGAGDLDAFWRNLAAGVDSLDRTDQNAGAPARGATDVRVSGALETGDWFDPDFFEIAAREASWIDPQHRMFLEHAWHALEHAGQDAEQYAGTIGVFAGASGSTYLLELLDLYRQSAESDRLQMMFGNSPSYLSTRVSYKLGLTGPSYTIATACSSSLAAVHVACQSLLAFECDMALAGGVAIQSPKRTSYRYEPGGIVSPDGYCRAFDAAADGTVFSDGVGVVALKRLADARADGDRLLAIVKGTAVNNDGGNKAGYAAPSPRGQRAVIAEAFANAGVTAETIGYIEAHGTGTRLGDAVELRALREAFAATGACTTGSCAIGSVKANIGHADAASGVAGLVKAVMCLEHRTLVPQPHYESPNPELDLENGPFYVNRSTRAWPSHGPRRAGVSSFGVGGTNVHVVLEEAPSREAEASSRLFHLWPISAKTPAALRARVNDLRSFLERREMLSAADVAFTLQAGRRAFEHRAAIVCRDAADGTRRLHDAMEGDERPVPAGAQPSLLFPPTREPWPDYRPLDQSEPVFRRHVDELLAALFTLAPTEDRDTLRDAMLRGETTPGIHVRVAERARPLIVPLALAKTLVTWGVRPEAATGGGVGALVARCFNGALTVGQALRSLLASAVAEDLAGASRSAACVVEIGASVRTIREGSAGTSLRSIAARSTELADPAFSLAKAVGDLWLLGAHIDWAAYRPDARRCRVALPSYPFHRRPFAVRAASETRASLLPTARPVRAERPALSTNYRAARTETEKAVALVFCEMLGFETVGVDDDFFELGGDSILAASVLAKIHERQGVDLATEALLEHPTVAFVAGLLDTRARGATAEPIVERAHTAASSESLLLDALERIERSETSS